MYFSALARQVFRTMASAFMPPAPIIPTGLALVTAHLMPDGTAYQPGRYHTNVRLLGPRPTLNRNSIMPISR